MTGSFDTTTTPVSLLLVDDRADNRTALKAILATRDYRIVEADSSSAALLRLLEEEFAVLLIDVVMPGMNGLELAQAIKERERTASVPIVFMTAEAIDAELIYKAYGIGAVDYLVKPLVPEMVRAKVAVFAELHRQRKRIEQQAARLVEAERSEGELTLAELRLASERRYKALADAVPDIIWTGRPDGSVDYFNRRWFEYTGVTAEEAAGSWYRAVHFDDVARCKSGWGAALGTGQMFQVECRLRRAADGVFRWHLGRAVPEVASAGRITSWLGTFTDIDDQKRAESVLAEFKGTLDAVLDAVFIFDPDRLSFLYVNHGAEVLTGYRQEDLLRMLPFELMTEYDENRFRELLAPLKKEGSKSAVTLEARCRRRDGREIPIELSLQLVRMDGSHVVSIARDITNRKIAELEREHLYREALAAIRSRDEFLSIASHELRTPLSSLQLQIEMLVRPPRNAEQQAPSWERIKEKLAMAARQVDKLAKLIATLMDVSRITAGRWQIDLEEVDLSGVAREAVARFGEEAARVGSSLNLRADQAVIGRWDRLRMDQVVTNLLGNALKFGSGKSVEIAVGKEGAFACLVVRDHGIGIGPEDIDRVFQRFERAGSARAYAGLGLGLYIVRQIVGAHGGTIRVESQPGSGSTFKVELPLQPPPALEAGAHTAEGASREKPPTSR